MSSNSCGLHFCVYGPLCTTTVMGVVSLSNTHLIYCIQRGRENTLAVVSRGGEKQRERKRGCEGPEVINKSNILLELHQLSCMINPYFLGFSGFLRHG